MTAEELRAKFVEAGADMAQVDTVLAAIAEDANEYNREHKIRSVATAFEGYRNRLFQPIVPGIVNFFMDRKGQTYQLGYGGHYRLAWWLGLDDSWTLEKAGWLHASNDTWPSEGYTPSVDFYGAPNRAQERAIETQLAGRVRLHPYPKREIEHAEELAVAKVEKLRRSFERAKVSA